MWITSSSPLGQDHNMWKLEKTGKVFIIWASCYKYIHTYRKGDREIDTFISSTIRLRMAAKFHFMSFFIYLALAIGTFRSCDGYANFENADNDTIARICETLEVDHSAETNLVTGDDSWVSVHVLQHTFTSGTTKKIKGTYTAILFFLWMPPTHQPTTKTNQIMFTFVCHSITFQISFFSQHIWTVFFNIVRLKRMT